VLPTSYDCSLPLLGLAFPRTSSEDLLRRPVTHTSLAGIKRSYATVSGQETVHGRFFFLIFFI